ncbi:MAG: serine/threonine protein kinase, partial [Deltaproteobacteria bacterium]
MALADKYRLGERIGGGGMAEVFAATLSGAEGFARRVAIKRVLPTWSADPAFADMFVNEARIASLLQHPNVVSVLDFDRDADGRLFLVMEFIDGVDLRQLIHTGALPPPIAAHVTAEMLRALDYAHTLEHGGRPLGIVHRDVSPHNVLLSWSGGVKLSDFGIAKAFAATGASATGSVKGKAAYMSPEQAHGRRLDGRADLFAVGVVLHEMLTGRRLFAGATEAESLARMLAMPIPNPREWSPSAPDDLAAVALQLLARDPADRFASAAAALEAVLSCECVTPRGATALAALLRERFPDRAPARPRSAAAPVEAWAAGSGPAELPDGATTPLLPASDAPTRTTAADPTPRPPAVAAGTPAAGDPVVTPVPLPVRSSLWRRAAAAIAIAVVAAVAAYAGARALGGRGAGRAGDRPAATGAEVAPAAAADA